MKKVSKTMRKQLCILAAAVVPMFGQSVNLSGIVTDSSGAPMAAVAVNLEKGGQTATTGADGRFTLTSGSAVREIHSAPWAAIQGGSLLLTLPENSAVTLTAYGVQGRALGTLGKSLPTGEHALKLPDFGSGVRFFRVKSGRREMIAKAFSMDGALLGAATGRHAASRSALGKQAAGSAAYYDVLTATKTGYQKGYVSLTKPDSTNIRVKLLGASSPKFSFFATSMKAMIELSGSPNGFGGNLTFGETGQGAGLRGADKICATIAERSMPGSYHKGWRAFLSVGADSEGKQANAIDRIGTGPWHDRLGRLLAPTKSDLLSNRPMNGDPTIANDLPNEDGVPNHKPDPTKPAVDNHHFLTGSDAQGRLYTPTGNFTCGSWTSNAKTVGIRPRVGFSWPAGGRLNWISGQDEGGCGAGINVAETGGSDPNNPIVGSGGGYGGFYCFALNP